VAQGSSKSPPTPQGRHSSPGPHIRADGQAMKAVSDPCWSRIQRRGHEAHRPWPLSCPLLVLCRPPLSPRSPPWLICMFVLSKNLVGAPRGPKCLQVWAGQLLPVSSPSYPASPRVQAVCQEALWMESEVWVGVSAQLQRVRLEEASGAWRLPSFCSASGETETQTCSGMSHHAIVSLISVPAS
jgi:hypothetical protein